MSEGESYIESGEPREVKKEEFKPSWIFAEENELRGLKIDEETKFGKSVLLLHNTPLFALTTDHLKEIVSNIHNLAVEENVSQRVYGFVIGKISDAILAMENLAEQKGVSGSADDTALEELVEINRKILEASTSLAGLQREQMGLLKKSGFSGFVSSLEARAGINVQQFDTEVPVWYDSLSKEWKDVVRTHLGILLGSYYKLRSPVKGTEMLISSEDIRIDREAMATSWEKLPGFRQAMVTMVFELFELKDGKLILTQSGKDKLSSFNLYREDLEKRIKAFLDSEEGEGLLGLLGQDKGGPRELANDTDLLARFAVATSFNFLYLSGVFESGDLGKGVKDPQVFNPSFRTFCLPRDQAKSKYIIGESDIVGTDEAWGGKLGEWLAERVRHNPTFKIMFQSEDWDKQGVTRIIPERLMYSLLELTYFKDGNSLSSALARIFSSRRSCNGGVFDFTDPSLVNWRDLKYQELWGGYSDVMDSAWKIYQAIIGRADPKEFDRQTLANALSKLRKEKTLKEIYTGEKGEWILKAVLTSLYGGPHLYSDEILLRLPEDSYDYQVWYWLNDDRVLAGLPNGARGRIFSFLNAKDLDSPISTFASYFQGSLGKRRKIRSEIAHEQAKWRGN